MKNSLIVCGRENDGQAADADGGSGQSVGVPFHPAQGNKKSRPE